MSANVKFAYSSANVFPLKVLLHQKLLLAAKLDKRILPIHIQLNPTNRCNFNCTFCSCSNRDKQLELAYDDIKFCMKELRGLGAESVTITGGGEPLMHSQFPRIINYLIESSYALGLVTNGVFLKMVPSSVLEAFTWIRISCSDVLPMQLMGNENLEKWFKTVDETVARAKTDWAFSYVVGNTPNYPLTRRIVQFANDHDFTHVRFVSDIFHARTLGFLMSSVEAGMKQYGIEDSKVNYQARDDWQHGQRPCYISLLKPVIGADGYLYPCCGTQYAQATPARDYEKTMRMGHIKDLGKIYDKQAFFDGSKCVKCYYSDYNGVLGYMLNGIKHEKFV